MRKTLGSLAVLLALASMPCDLVAADGGVACHYAQGEARGELSIVNAAGSAFVATDVGGNVVAAGAVLTGWFTIPIIGALPGPLAVRVGDEFLLASVDRNSDWQ